MTLSFINKISIFCILLFVQCSCLASIDEKISFYLSKYKLANIKPLFVIALNPTDCQKYKLAIHSIVDLASLSNKKNNLVFLIAGLRQVEIKYFAEKELNLSSDSIKFIADNDFYKEINRDLYSSLTVIEDGEIKSTSQIYNISRTIFFSNYEYHLNFLDSITLEEKSAPISNWSKIQELNDSEMVILDPTYNNLSIYNINTGKQEKTCEFKYDYEYLYKYYISQDTSKINYALRNRNYFTELNWKEIDLKNLSVKNDKIYVTAQISYFRSSEDTSNSSTLKLNITPYQFLIIFDKRFEKQEYIHLPSSLLPKNIFLNVNNPFIFDDLNNFAILSIQKDLRNVSISEQFNNLPFFTQFSFDPQTKKFTSSRVMNLTLPKWFEEKKLKYNLTMYNFLYVDDMPYVYFKKTPFLYDLDGKIILEIPDTTYKLKAINTDDPQWYLNLDDKRFLLERLNYTQTGDIAYFVFFDKKYYFAIIDSNTGKYKYKVDFNINGPFAIDGYILTNKRFFILKTDQEKVVLFKFQY